MEAITAHDTPRRAHSVAAQGGINAARARRVDGDQLSIEGEARVIAPAGLEISHAEVALPRYRRTFTRSNELDAGKVSAELSQGELRVRIPKAEHAHPRKISVQVA